MIFGRRTASLAVPWLAVAMFSIGLTMLVNPLAYQSPSYTVAFSLMGPRYWGLLMILTAFSSVFYIHALTTFALCAVCLTYAGFLLAAVVSGDAASPTGWIWPLTCGLITAQSVARRGIHGRA